jgi:hypothetical protein
MVGDWTRILDQNESTSVDESLFSGFFLRPERTALAYRWVFRSRVCCEWSVVARGGLLGGVGHAVTLSMDLLLSGVCLRCVVARGGLLGLRDTYS